MTEERKMPVRSRRVELDGDWEGWWFEARVNAPLGVLSDLSSGNFRLIVRALQKIVLDWNFVGEEGEVLEPDAYGVYPCDRVTPELYNKMAARFYEETAKLPPE